MLQVGAFFISRTEGRCTMPVFDSFWWMPLSRIVSLFPPNVSLQLDSAQLEVYALLICEQDSSNGGTPHRKKKYVLHVTLPDTFVDQYQTSRLLRTKTCQLVHVNTLRCLCLSA